MLKFLIEQQCIYYYENYVMNSSCYAVASHSIVSDSLQPHGLYPTRLLCPWGSSRQEYWSGLPCPSPRDLPNPGIEPRSPALQAEGSPRILEWVAYPFSRGSSWPRNQTGSPALQPGSLPAELPREALFSSWLYPNECMHFILMSVLELMIILHQ